MRRTLRDLADARKELLEIQQEFGRLQKRIEAVRDCVTDSLKRIFGEERPAMAALAEEELIEKLAGRVAARLGAVANMTQGVEDPSLLVRQRRIEVASQ